jgi:hypothetical protein
VSCVRGMFRMVLRWPLALALALAGAFAFVAVLSLARSHGVVLTLQGVGIASRTITGNACTVEQRQPVRSCLLTQKLRQEQGCACRARPSAACAKLGLALAMASCSKPHGASSH